MAPALEDLSDLLRKIREKGGYGSIDEAAPKFGVSRGTLGAFERGKRPPDIDFLARFSQTTGADLNELLRLRVAAGGHQAEDLWGNEARDAAGRYEVPADLSAVRARFLTSLMPPDWAVFLTELVARGKISVEAAREIAEFWDNWQPDPGYLQHLLADSERHKGGES